MRLFYLVLLFLLLAPAFAGAQAISINTDASSPDPSAILDVKSTDKGVLVPRMTTAQRSAITAANALLVFDADTRSFWFFDTPVAAWREIRAGNIATLQDADGNTKVQVEKNPNEDIIRFDLGGTESMVLRKNAGGIPRLELTDLFNNTYVGQDAGQNTTTGRSNTATGKSALASNTSGTDNTASGFEALLSNTSGGYNTANGSQALYSNTTGYDNTANGTFALRANTTGDHNTANGTAALYSNTTGIYNTAQGAFALFSNSTGSRNTGVGAGANVYYDTLNNATALGYAAIVGCSNCLVLGGKGSDAVNVGIGTDLPGQKLDVRSAGPDLPAVFVLSNSNLSHKLGFFPGRLSDPNPFVQWKDGDPLRFATDAGGFSEKMRITTDGNVGIGTPTPQSELEVKIPFNTTDSTAGLQLNAGERRWRMTVGGTEAGGNPAYFQVLFKNQANPYVPYLTVSSTGNLGVGRIPATNRLEVEGNASKATAGSWVANSDARLKKNITPLDSHEMLDKLLALQGVTYEWNDDKTGSARPEGVQYGFVAQNIQTVFPTLVEEDKLGYLQTAYGTYDAMTVEAIRALHEEIGALKAENAAQKAENAVMKAQLDKITAALQTAGINLENR